MNEPTKEEKRHVVNKSNMDQPQEEFIDASSSSAAPADEAGEKKTVEPPPKQPE